MLTRNSLQGGTRAILTSQLKKPRHREAKGITGRIRWRCKQDEEQPGSNPSSRAPKSLVFSPLQPSLRVPETSTVTLVTKVIRPQTPCCFEFGILCFFQLWKDTYWRKIGNPGGKIRLLDHWRAWFTCGCFYPRLFSGQCMSQIFDAKLVSWNSTLSFAFYNLF